MKKDAYNIHSDIQKIEKLSSKEIDELYRQENVGGNKFEKKLKQLKQEYEDLTGKIVEDSAESRLYNAIFRSSDERKKINDNNSDIYKKRRALEEQIEQYKEYVEESKVELVGVNITNNRVFPSYELQLKVIEANLYLCEIYANKYYDKLNGKVPYDDLFQTAYLGLHSAARYYIPSDIATFNTYASKCIENRIDKEYIHKKKRKKKDLSYNEILLELDLLLDFITLWDTKRYGKTIEFINNNNQKLYLMGVPKYSIQHRKRTKGEKKKTLWLYFVKIYNSVTKSIGLSLSISNEERDIISQELVHKHKFGNELKKATFESYLKLYMNRLINAIIYNEAIKELKENDLPTTDEEIIRCANKIIRRNKARFSRIKKLSTEINGVSLSKNDKIWCEYINRYQQMYGIDKMWYDTIWDKGGRVNKPFDEECEDIYPEWLYRDEIKSFKTYYKIITDNIKKIDESYDENIVSCFNVILGALKTIQEDKDIKDIDARYIEDRDVRMEFLSMANPPLTDDDFDYDLSDINAAYDKFKTKTLPKLQKVIRMLEIEKEVKYFRDEVEISTNEINNYYDKLDEKKKIAKQSYDEMANISLYIIKNIAGKKFVESHGYYHKVLEYRLRDLDPVQKSKLIDDYEELVEIALNTCENTSISLIKETEDAEDHVSYYAGKINDDLSSMLWKMSEKSEHNWFARFTKDEINIIKEKNPVVYGLLNDVWNRRMTMYDFYTKFKGEYLKELTELVKPENGFDEEAVDAIKYANETIPNIDKNVSLYRKYEKEFKENISKILEHNNAMLEKALKENDGYNSLDDFINDENKNSAERYFRENKDKFKYISNGLAKSIEETNADIEISRSIESIKREYVGMIINAIPSEQYFADVHKVYSHRFPGIYELIDKWKDNHDADEFLDEFRNTQLPKINDLKHHHDKTRQGTYRLAYCKKIMGERKKRVRKMSDNVVNGIYEQNRELFYLSLFTKLKIKLWDQDKLDEIKSFYSAQRKNNDHFMEEFDDKKEYKSVTTFNEKIHTLEDEIIAKQFRADYNSCLLELSTLERRVLKRWIDENGKHSYTSKEIAEELQIDEGEVKKIKTKALRSIRNNPRMQKYKGTFLD